MSESALHNRRIWVTGASSGIGRAVVVELARRGARVIASGRSQQRLEEVATTCPGQITPLPFDVTNYEAVIAAGQRIKQEFEALDVALFNAGDCFYIDVAHFDARLLERLFQINVIGMAYCVEAALPLLRAGSRPQLVGMSSTVAYAGLPRSEAYGATKAAIRNMFQSLSIDLAPEKIEVSVICPGFVKTPLTEKNDFPMPFAVSAERAAEIICDGIVGRRAEIHFPLRFSLPFKFLSSLPAPLYKKLASSLIRRKP